MKIRPLLSISLCGLLLLLGGNKPAAADLDTMQDFFLKTADQYKNVLVKRVLSTNTIVLDQGEKIKLIGLKAPETPRNREKKRRNEFGFVVPEDDDPVLTIEEQAFDFAKDLLEGKYVRLEFDSNRKTEKFETYAYVFIVNNDLFANEEILRQGYAKLQIRPPNTKYAEQLRTAYKEARREKRGLQGQ